MKKRVSIYIDDLVWENVKEHAWRQRKSASQFLEDVLDGDTLVAPLKESGSVLVKKELIDSVIDEVDIEAENEKLIEKRKKITELKAGLQFHKPQPKAKWKGAK